MPDSRFYVTKSPISLSAAAEAIGARGSSYGQDQLVRVADPTECDLQGAIVYCETLTTAALLVKKNYGLCLTTDGLVDKVGAGPTLAVASPKLGFAILSAMLHLSREDVSLEPGKIADLNETAEIHSSAVISAGAKIGASVRIGPNCSIGCGVTIGDGSRVEAGVSISHAILGRNIHILPGAQIGQAGFGFVEGEDGFVRVPQLGRVIIGDHVEIGANTTIDRGALGDTIIGEGAKIDNLIQIGHNVQIGRYCVLAAQVGISGSCIIGDGVMLGGQVGLADHLNIGDNAKIAAGSGLMHDVPPGEIWAGRPGRPIKSWLREIATLKRLAKKKNG